MALGTTLVVHHPPPNVLDPMSWAGRHTPGPMHEHLRPLVGTWSAATKVYRTPDAPPQQLTGAMRTDLLLGGRFLHSTYSGDAREHPFSGISILGYNTIVRRYEGVWIDNLSTSAMFSTGGADAAGRVITMTSELPDPAAGRVRRVRSVTTIVSNDANTYEMYELMPDGAVRKTLEVAYTRRR